MHILFLFLKKNAVRDLKLIWSEMEASFDFVKSKQMLSSSSFPHGMISVPCKSDKKPKFMSRLRRFFYVNAECTRPDAVALQEVADVTASFVAARCATATAAGATSTATAAPPVATAAAQRRAPAPPPQWGAVHSSSSSSSLPAAAAARNNSRHNQYHQYQQLAAAAMTAGGNYIPWTVHAGAAAAGAGAAVSNFFPYPNHGGQHQPHCTVRYYSDSHKDGSSAPYSEAFSSSTAAASSASSSAATNPPSSGLEAMLRQFENETNYSINNFGRSSGAPPAPEQEQQLQLQNGGGDNDEDDSLRPQNAIEASILAELQAFGFTDAREVLEGIRRLTAKNASNAAPSVDDVMVDLVTQREDLEHARQVDEARLASEALRKEEAKRRRASIAAELKVRRLEAPLREWLNDFFCHSWILSTHHAYDVIDKCMILASSNSNNNSSSNSSGGGEQATTTTATAATTEFRDALFELLDTEKNSRQWYGKHLPRAYFTVLVCKRLVDAGENAESLTKQLLAESETLKRELFTLSGKKNNN
jgi:hypothetical protein